jgi:hypothetical protein
VRDETNPKDDAAKFEIEHYFEYQQ